MIGKEDVEKLANLARIRISPEEMDSLALEVDSILGYVDQIKSVKADASAAESPTTRNIFRDDGEPHKSGLYTKKILKEAPQREGEYLKVKKIL